MKGYKLAEHLYKAIESKEWLERQRERSKSPLEFYDIASQHFKNIMEALSVQPRKVMIEILLTYHNGIRCNELAKRTMLDINTVSSAVQRLYKAGLIQRVKDAPRSPYRVVDLDFLGVCATRWDGNWKRFSQENPQETDVAVFIAERCNKPDIVPFQVDNIYNPNGQFYQRGWRQ